MWCVKPGVGAKTVTVPLRAWACDSEKARKNAWASGSENRHTQQQQQQRISPCPQQSWKAVEVGGGFKVHLQKNTELKVCGFRLQPYGKKL